MCLACAAEIVLPFVITSALSLCVALVAYSGILGWGASWAKEWFVIAGAFGAAGAFLYFGAWWEHRQRAKAREEAAVESVRQPTSPELDRWRAPSVAGRTDLGHAQ